jgi:hypothetical protein
VALHVWVLDVQLLIAQDIAEVGPGSSPSHGSISKRRKTGWPVERTATTLLNWLVHYGPSLISAGGGILSFIDFLELLKAINPIISLTTASVN